MVEEDFWIESRMNVLIAYYDVTQTLQSDHAKPPHRRDTRHPTGRTPPKIILRGIPGCVRLAILLGKEAFTTFRGLFLGSCFLPQR